ncbi:hypothetical protein BDV30DRAFT_238923 [Aspergillus minisclerotigenes]|uniref:Uncharacterized protein n=1 Tax=Aspergillus minisclerotigenes TaxID=656917 RepID=A0A5N6J2C7_9EURO|nr:hypothetical protein BDV30DRAFT_238923 [Aspergillus minisclerotigenes]
MKIQLLLSLIALGFTLGEPIPKQALSQRQADDNSSSPKPCEAWRERMMDLKTQTFQARQDYYNGMPNLSRVQDLYSQIAELTQQKPAGCPWVIN